MSNTVFYVGNALENVWITPEHPRVLIGDTLALTCSGNTTFNGQIQFDWQFQNNPVSLHDKTKSIIYTL